jgi:hypothetical protein
LTRSPPRPVGEGQDANHPCGRHEGPRQDRLVVFVKAPHDIDGQQSDVAETIDEVRDGCVGREVAPLAPSWSPVAQGTMSANSVAGWKAIGKTTSIGLTGCRLSFVIERRFLSELQGTMRGKPIRRNLGPGLGLTRGA